MKSLVVRTEADTALRPVQLKSIQVSLWPHIAVSESIDLTSLRMTLPQSSANSVMGFFDIQTVEIAPAMPFSPLRLSLDLFCATQGTAISPFQE